MYQNIPDELKALPQWVIATPDRTPINPRTGEAASVNDPSTWATYKEVVATGKMIGFVITSADPYCFIDIDNKLSNPATPEQIERHQRILEAFDSYTELSLSGRGYHIIIRGSIPHGIDRDHVGVYSSQRYMIMTGNMVRNSPIRDYHDLVNILHAEACKNKGTNEFTDSEQEIPDEDLIQRAIHADNKDKFIALCRGDISGYPSQSEADLALLSMLAFYSPNNEQVKRIFRMTELGKRKKAERDSYLNNTIKFIRSNEPAPIDFSQFKIPEPTIEEQEDKSIPFSLPGGLLGELATYFYQTAIRPVPEVALAAAIGLMSGIAGRSYNVSGTGLNQYIVLLAQTGVGKEGALSGIETLLAHVRMQVPTVDQFLGPAAFASGQAIIKVLAERPCFVSVLGEFGLTLQNISDSRANSADRMYRQVLLDLYTKSGWGKMLRSSVYSDTDKNTKIVQAPCLSILGESTPERFFEGLDISHVAEGLIPRFSVIEYKGDRPPRNQTFGTPPDTDLISKVINLIVTTQAMTANNRCMSISLSTPALELLGAFDEEADKRINEGSEVAKQLWNRAHLKALKMGALIAVGIDLHNPVIDEAAATWAIDFVRRDIKIVHDRFESGDVGTGDSKQLADVRRAIKKLMTTPTKDPKIETMRIDGIVSYRTLSQRVLQIASLRNDKLGATNALKKIMQTLADTGELAIVKDARVAQKYGYNGLAYGVY